jgi:disulfide oxidoreductase YuzD
MNSKKVEISVYGAEQLCASCVHLPSARETYEWIEAAVSRKFPDQPFTITYIDINHPPDDTFKKEFARKVIEEDMFYPVVLVDGELVGEGNPKLKTIFAEMERHGYRAN